MIRPNSPDVSPELPKKKFWTETRANVVFIIVIVALVLPGAIIMTKKKLSKNEGYPMLSQPVRRELAYIDITAGNSALPRVVPPLTGDFVASITSQRLFYHEGLQSLVELGSKIPPILSADRSTQLVAMNTTPGRTAFGLLCWSDNATPVDEIWSFSAQTDAGPAPAKGVGMEMILLPLDVRRELQKYGYINPPAQVIWILVRVDSEQRVKSLRVKYEGRKTQIDQTISIPFDGSSQAATLSN